MQWYIDAWDVSAGRAFLSERNEGQVTDIESDCVFVSPPSFNDRTNAPRSAALAATRAGFQLGVYLDDQEVAFETLEDAVTLVRRAYGAGGLGPGPDGTAPPPAPLPTEGGEGPSFDGPEGEGGAKLARHLAEQFAHFSEARQKIGDTQTSMLYKWQAGFGNVRNVGGETKAMLIKAGHNLHAAMLKRCPTKGARELLQWLRCYAKFSHNIFRIGIGDEVYGFSEKYIEFLERNGVYLHLVHDEILYFRRGIVSATGSRIWPDEQDEYWYLDAFPLPPPLVGKYQNYANPEPSVLSLLYGFMSLGVPGEKVHQTEIEIAFFAAVSMTMDWYAPNPSLGLVRPDILQLAYADIGQHAWHWLCDNLPTRIYRSDLEALLKHVPTLAVRLGKEPTVPDDAMNKIEIDDITDKELEVIRRIAPDLFGGITADDVNAMHRPDRRSRHPTP